jgi:hypothetical protein
LEGDDVPKIETLETAASGKITSYNTVQTDELLGLPEALQKALIDRGLVYLTNCVLHDGQSAAGTVIAKDQAQAETIATGRGLEEVVTGLIYGAD